MSSWIGQTPHGIVGRDAEIAAFDHLLHRGNKVKTLIIKGDSGVGKSLLLDVLAQVCEHHNSRWARIDLREISLGKVDILQRLAKQLQTISEFQNFLSIYDTYVRRLLKGGESTGKDERALQKEQTTLLEAFVSDLKNMKRSWFYRYRTTIFIDSFEQIRDTELESWLLSVFVEALRTGDWRNNEVLTVISGQPIDTLNAVQGAITRELKVFSPGMVEEYAAKFIGHLNEPTVNDALNLTNGHPLNVGILVDILKNVPDRSSYSIAVSRLLTRIGKGVDQNRVTRTLVDELLSQMIEVGAVVQVILLRKCAVPRWFDAEHISSLGALASARLPGTDFQYELGLNELLQAIGQAHPRYSDVLVYQQRLSDNTSRSLRYGDTEVLRADRSEVVEHLNALSLSVLKVSFNELCRPIISPITNVADSTSGGPVADEAYVKIEWLRNLSFIKRRTLGGYFYHENVRDALLERWRSDAPDFLPSLHRHWRQFYKSKQVTQEVESRRRNLVEEVYHLLRDKEDEGVELFAQQIQDMDSFRDMDFFTVLANELRSVNLLPQNKLWLNCFDGYEILYTGDWRLASAKFGEILSNSDASERLNAFVAYELGKVLAIRGDNPAAESLYLRALQIQRKRNDQVSVSRILLRLGQVYRWVGKWDQAIECFEEGRQIADSGSDRFSLAWILSNLGITYDLQGNLGKAKIISEEALSIYRQLKNPDGIGRTLRSLGETYINLGKYAEAENAFKECLSILEPSAQRYSLAKGHVDLALVNVRLERFDQVVSHLDRARLLIDQMNAKSMIPAFSRAHAEYKRAIGEPGEALRILEETQSIEDIKSSDGESSFGNAMRNMSIADYLKDLARNDEAKQYYEESIKKLRQLRAYYELSVAEVSLCEILLKQFGPHMGEDFNLLVSETTQLANRYMYHDVIARLATLNGHKRYLSGAVADAVIEYSKAHAEAIKYNALFAKKLLSGLPTELRQKVSQ